MDIAFYAPLKPPNHPVPSGDRRMARLLMAALGSAGHRVTLASTLRSWDDGSRPGRPERLAALGRHCAGRLIRHWRARPPRLWFTYHLYHKAPDWIGPAVADAFEIPYVVAEASYAPKRAQGPWAAGHRAAAAALARADAVINLAGVDSACVLPLLRAPDRLVGLPPFLDAAPYRAAAEHRTAHRRRLAEQWRLPSARAWLLAVGMMREGDKRRSYQVLARALQVLGSLGDWQLVVAGDGPCRGAVEADFAGVPPDRLSFLGAVAADQLPAWYAAADLMVWPAINEAYGMALLEAQAAGLPAVAGRSGGVPDVVCDGVSGLLVTPGDAVGFAAAIAALLEDPGRRRAMGRAALDRVAADHDFAGAVAALDAIVTRLASRGGPP
ncbi:MAG: glycosyltransferase [Azospirillum sp.]|nr:glycosyltransferase [Azospirillum sp.]